MADNSTSLGSSSLSIEPLHDQPVKKTPRPYQAELVEHALKENTIVNLGTGAGKTFVAVMLIKEMSADIQGEFTKKSGKRTVFLAHTVPLVKQQAGYIRDNAPLKVQDFCGDSKGIDGWPESKWYEIFNSNQVLVMSRQIFLDLLNRGVIAPRQLNLIVFDECHHATKNDPYVNIMKVIKDAPVEERPRVLGLSASLLAKKVKPGELKKGVVGLERILMSHARTAKDLQDVLRNATAPVEKILNYNINEDLVSSTLKNIINGPLVMFQTKLANRKIKLRLGEVAKNLYEDLLSILTDLGPASAAGFVTDAIRELKNSISIYQRDAEKFDLGLAMVALTHLTAFDLKCRSFLREYGKLNDSHKVKTLLLLLGDILLQTASTDSSENESSPKASHIPAKKQRDDLRGIIFVERRHTASCLCKLLKRKRKEESDLRSISCDFVVGHNVGQNATSIRKEARMKSSKQETTLAKFRRGTVNILIATSVIEEGVDVPKCNLVVRFDLPQNFRSYVQSKGRARNKPSLYYLLVGEHQGNKVADIKNYHRLEEELIQLCQEDRDRPTEEEIQKKMKDKVPPYMPNGRDGARATIGNSLTILHRYCNKLPHDDYTKLAPIFEVVKLPKDKTKDSIVLVGETEEEDEDPNHDYICTITLPINCPIRKPIKGPVMGSKLQAHRAAARYAVEELHKERELDDKFFPKQSIDSDDEETIKEKENPLSGTERRHWLYRNEVSGFVRGCYPMINEEVFLYAFIMTDVTTGSLYCSNPITTSEGETITTFGLLTRNQLPYRKIPRFSLFVKSVEEGEAEVHVSLIQLSDKPAFLKEELEVLSSYHRSVFSDVLQVIPQYMEWNITKCTSADKDYLIVPLRLNGNQLTSGGVDFELIADMDTAMAGSTKTWSCYNNALVSPTHREAVDIPIGTELYAVTVDQDITPLSPFPTPQFKSFQEYLQKKCNYEIKDVTQPGLKAYRFSINSLKYISSNYYGGGGSVSVMPQPPRGDKKLHTVLFPEIVKIYHIHANVFKLLKCLPSILWRLESLLLMEDLAAEFLRKDFMKDAVYTDTPLRYGDTPLGYGDIDGTIPTDVFSRKPDNSLLLQSFTPKAANDAVNLERLELLGDSLLKIVSSVYLYNQRVGQHEGKLSSARSRRISNVKLYMRAKYKKTILGKIQSNDMLMGSDSSGSPLERIRYIPPGFIITPSLSGDYCPQEINLDGLDVHLPTQEVSKYLYHRFNDKMVADCMEALIGACTVSGGIEGGLSFMEWLKLDISTPERDHLVFDPSISWAGESTNIPLIIAESSYIFRKHFGMMKPTQSGNSRETFNRFMAQTGGIQRTIGYVFTDHCLMFEALTHPSYSRPVSYGCFPRLEFLGDAVLDYLVTAQLFHSDHSMTPGTISSIRSALLCNRRLAELAIDMGLDKYCMHSSPDLFKEMGIYRSALMKKRLPLYSTEIDEEDLSGEDSEHESESDDEEGEEVASDDDNDDHDQSLDPPKPLSDMVEALCGAVFLDTKMSLSRTWEVFKKFIEPKMREYRQGNGDLHVPVNEVKQLYDLVPTGIQLKRKKVREGYRCVIKITARDINVNAVSRSFKNAKILAANQALKQLLAVKQQPNTS